MQRYLAPFPTSASRKPIYVFPRDVPVRGKPEHAAAAINSYHHWLRQTEIPKLFFHADPGVLIRTHEVPWIMENFPNTTAVDLGQGLHFVQEDHPHTIGREIAAWYHAIDAATPATRAVP
jgi:haloalkane dehalogenase